MNKNLFEMKKDLMTIEEGRHGYFTSRPYTEEDQEIKLIDFLDDHLVECDPFSDDKNYDDFIYDDFMADEIKEDFNRCVNSYNWNGPIVFQARPFVFKNREFTAFCIHRFGDVRGNYTRYACFEMPIDEFLDLLLEFEIDIPCEKWIVRQSILSESGVISAWNEDSQEDFNGYYESDDCPEEVKKAVSDWL